MNIKLILEVDLRQYALENKELSFAIVDGKRFVIHDDSGEQFDFDIIEKEGVKIHA